MAPCPIAFLDGMADLGEHRLTLSKGLSYTELRKSYGPGSVGQHQNRLQAAGGTPAQAYWHAGQDVVYPLPLRLVRPTGLDLLYFDMEIRGLTQDERCGAGYDKPTGHRHEKQR